MSEYKNVKLGKLRLKGQGDSKEKKKKKKRKHNDSENTSNSKESNEELSQYNGWWPLKSFEHLNCGTVAIQTCVKNAYVFAQDNGTLCLGSDHGDKKNGLPVDEEVLTLIKISDNKIALKTGYGYTVETFWQTGTKGSAVNVYGFMISKREAFEEHKWKRVLKGGKYVSVNARGDILARSEAVGPQEQIEIVIGDEKFALQGHNGYFITVTDEGEFKALSRTAKEKEIFCLRTNVSRSKKKKTDDEEDVGNVRQFEINYVKQFQSFKNNKLRLHEGPSSSLEKARTKGKLHEAMLDRREKMKADRYCK